MCLICYAIVLVGSLAIGIAIYGLVVFGLYKYQERLSHQMSGTMLRLQSFGAISLRPYIDSQYEYSTFEYQKGADVMNDCVVCLSGFEDVEDVRLLPQCKHTFHGPCIDMWLYSHSDCPVCRSPVEKRASAVEKENSQEAALHISIST